MILPLCFALFSGIFVEFEQTQYTVIEGAGLVEICLISDGSNNVNIVIDVQPQETVPPSATGKHVALVRCVMTSVNLITDRNLLDVLFRGDLLTYVILVFCLCNPIVA